jgi:predicted amidohydrolase YtcJ
MVDTASDARATGNGTATDPVGHPLPRARHMPYRRRVSKVSAPRAPTPALRAPAFPHPAAALSSPFGSGRLTARNTPFHPTRSEMTLRSVPLVFCLLVATVAQAQQPATAELIVTGARIYTVDDNRPVAEAMAIRGGRILFVGSERGALAHRGSASRVVDLGGRTVIPGMVDAHAHLEGLGTALRTVDLVGTRSYEEVIARVAARAREMPAGTWVVGRGWDQNQWGDTRFPSHQALSSAVPDHPVYLTRVDGHAALVNDAALRAAGVSASTGDPEGGRIERASDGAPAGVLVDAAMGLVASRIPDSPRAERITAIRAAIAEANRWGLTGIHDAGVDAGTIDIYEELARAGTYDLRNYVMIRSDDETLERYFSRGPQSGIHGGRLWIRSIKISADGALGSRGAALLEPYSDESHHTGLVLTSPERVREVAARALRAGFQLNTHAIGDRANRFVLDAYEAALGENPRSDHRFRVEHAQILHPQDIPRFAALDVIPSMQASHQTSDMYWAERRVGSTRLLGSYAWRSLLDLGVPIPNGSDFPVEAVNPLISFHSSVTRQDADRYPAGGWYPAQRMTREEALRSMTIWPAYAAFQEEELGSLTPGKYADFVVLDRDIMRVAPEEILGTRVLATYLGGRAVYEAGSD